MYMRGRIAVAVAAVMIAGTLGCVNVSDGAELADGLVAGAS